MLQVDMLLSKHKKPEKFRVTILLVGKHNLSIICFQALWFTSLPLKVFGVILGIQHLDGWMDGRKTWMEDGWKTRMDGWMDG